MKKKRKKRDNDEIITILKNENDELINITVNKW